MEQNIVWQSVKWDVGERRWQCHLAARSWTISGQVGLNPWGTFMPRGSMVPSSGTYTLRVDLLDHGKHPRSVVLALDLPSLAFAQHLASHWIRHFASVVREGDDGVGERVSSSF